MKYIPSVIDKMANIDKMKMGRNALAVDVSERADSQHAALLSRMKKRKMMAARKKERDMVAAQGLADINGI